MAKREPKAARRYARALFEATPPAELEDQERALQELLETWTANTNLRAALVNPVVVDADRLSVVRELAQRLRPNSETFANFVALLTTHQRLAELAGIVAAFGTLVRNFRRLCALEVSSATEIDQGEQQHLQSNIEMTLGAPVNIVWRVDPALLGGVMVRAGDRVLDSTIRGSLRRLRAELLT